ncbi:MAG TPA: pseudouridine synthase, partial [Devosia sp.]
MTDPATISLAGDRLAKIIARAGLCSRRDAELWIKDGRVSVNGKVVKTPAFNVTDKDKIKVDGEPLAAKQGTRVWLYHKPAGLVVTEKDPEGRPTIFEALDEHGLPRVVSIGRLDINTEGLLLLTNDGGLKRVLELPATGWLRKYRVRAFGSVTQAQLDQLKEGVEVDGIKYGPIEATLERDLGSNVWLVVALREGKNREVKNVLASLGLTVNRLIRVSYGPFQLGDIREGEVETVRARVLREQLGKRLADEAGVDFDADMPEQATAIDRKRAVNPRLRAAAPGKPAPKQRKALEDSTAQFRFVDRDRETDEEGARQRRDRPGGRFSQKRSAAPAGQPEREEPPLRTVHNEDGTTSQIRVRKPRPERPDPEDRSFRDGGFRGPKGLGGERPAARAEGAKSFGAKRTSKPREDGDDRGPRKFGDKPPRGNFADRPKRDYGDKPRSDFGDRPPRRDFGDRPPRREAGERPARSFGDKPRRDFGDRPGGDRPSKSFGPKKFGDKKFGDKKPFGEKRAFG